MNGGGSTSRTGGSAPRAYPVEEFLQALTAQLDRAQDALAVKVTGTNRPLTWALKDISIDLRVFVDVNPSGRVTLRSAAPNEDGASTVHLTLTTITRPMVEENALEGEVAVMLALMHPVFGPLSHLMMEETVAKEVTE